MKRPAVVPAHVTCVLPGLVWPGEGIQSALDFERVRGLAAIVGRGSIETASPERFLPWLRHEFDVDETLSWAACRYAGEQKIPPLQQGEQCLCADPVSLAFSRDSLLLGGPESLELTDDEAGTLIQYLNAEFPDVGRFVMASATRWYLVTRDIAEARFHALEDVAGRPIALFQPEGPNAGHWAHLANEIQVALYNHPINQRRQDEGRPTANGIWLWGYGTTKAGDTSRLKHLVDTIYSRDPLVLGLSRLAGVIAIDSSEGLTADSGRAGRTWWHDGALSAAARLGDMRAWADALVRIDHELLQPLFHAWKARRIQSLTIVACSDKVKLTLRLGAGAHWKIWCSDAPRSTLQALLQTPYTQKTISAETLPR